MKLTAKEEKYAQALFRGLSQRKAYKEAYKNSRQWKDNTVDARACELAKKSKIVGRLDELRDAQTKESSWTVEKLIGEFAAVKEKCMQEVEVEKFNPETGQMEGTGEYVFKENGVIKALENIGKLLGHYTDKVQIDVVNIEVDIEEDDADD